MNRLSFSPFPVRCPFGSSFASRQLPERDRTEVHSSARDPLFQRGSTQLALSHSWDRQTIASLAPRGKVRPYDVLDDGWQDKTRFPDLPALAAQLRQPNVWPGIWLRPLRAKKTAAANLLLPQARFVSKSSRNELAYDPTNPEALQAIMQQAVFQLDGVSIHQARFINL